MLPKFVFGGLVCVFILLTVSVALTEGWRGGCSRYRIYSCVQWYRDWRCKPGWRHNGDYNCIIPICASGCDDGECVAPNECQCPSTSIGQFCQTLVCSYNLPCYPGNCYNNDQCNCTQGFLNEPSTSGCLKMGDSNRPYIGRSTTIITHRRETDSATLYYFLLDGTDDDPAKRVVWSNQQFFNRLSFEFEMKYDQPEEMPEYPQYVREVELGIVHADVKLKVFDFNGVTMNRTHYSSECTGVSSLAPTAEVFNCTIDDLHFKTLVEDADTLQVTFSASSGGYRRLINLDDQILLSRTPFENAIATKELEFKFDFRTPKYCSEPTRNLVCTSDDTILEVIEEFTKDPIHLRWSGWADTEHGSGLDYFMIELHTLVVNDERNTLTEMNPIRPVYSRNVTTDGSREYFFDVIPPVSGMYSVLFEVTDVANNSRLARRFVLYDPDSEITLDTSGKGLHVNSAAEETGYLWQSNLADYYRNLMGYWNHQRIQELNRIVIETQQGAVMLSKEGDTIRRIELDAYDYESGVFRIALDIAIFTPGVNEDVTVINIERPGNFELMQDGRAGCEYSGDEWKCFRRQQRVVMDNCWFMLPVKEDLAVSSATVNVTVYNQAMLSQKTQLSIPSLNKLNGLTSAPGYSNVRIENQQKSSFRVAWDHPNSRSCYSMADIFLSIKYELHGITNEQEHRIVSTNEYFDVGNMPADTTFTVLFSIALFGNVSTTPVTLIAQTQTVSTSISSSKGTEQKMNLYLIIGSSVGGSILVLIVILCLVHRYVIKSEKRVRPKDTTIYRKDDNFLGNKHIETTNDGIFYNDEIKSKDMPAWHLDRNEISIQSKIKSGHFADIYIISIKNDRNIKHTAVAKILKANYSHEDELVMKSQINFLATKVGNHPNIITFIGAIPNDDALGPFIIYEYCENGTLKQFLTAQKSCNTVNLHGKLTGFGLSIARGMDFLVHKNIVHGRLSTRNILLTSKHEIKITGFGPQSTVVKIDGETEKRRKKHIRLMAPECMRSSKDVNEKSDVWSYAVVLWEIFSLGDTPYSDIKRKELRKRIIDGSRLQQPEHCNESLYELMCKCWSYSPEERPTFSQIRTALW